MDINVKTLKLSYKFVLRTIFGDCAQSIQVIDLKMSEEFWKVHNILHALYSVVLHFLMKVSLQNLDFGGDP